MRKKNNNGIGWLLRNVQFRSILCGDMWKCESNNPRKWRKKIRAEIGLFLFVFHCWCWLFDRVSVLKCKTMFLHVFMYECDGSFFDTHHALVQINTSSICVFVCVSRITIWPFAQYFFCFVFSSSFFRFNAGRWQKNVFYILVLFVLLAYHLIFFPVFTDA